MTSEGKPRPPRALKVLVFGLGALILIGLAVVVATIVNRAGKPKPPPSEVSVALPPHCRVVDGWSDNRLLYLRLTGAGCEGVIVLDGDKIVTRYTVIVK